MADVLPMSLQEEQEDGEKNRCVNKLMDICLSLTEQVIRLKEMIEADRSSVERRRAAAMAPLPPYSYTAALVEPFVREIRRRQEQEEEQRIDDVEQSDSKEEQDCDCRRVERVYSMPPPCKRRKLQ